MISNMMRRLHMGCGESLKGSYAIPTKQNYAVNQIVRVAQKKPLQLSHRGKKRL